MEPTIKTIQSIQRAINIINCFDEDNVALSLNKISERLRLNINTTRGIMNTLVANGLITHNNDNTYSLGFFFLPKAALLNQTCIGEIKDKSFLFLDYLAEKYRVSSRLQIATSQGIYTANTANPRDSHYLLSSSQTMPFPLHATASGKIFLAYNRKLLHSLVFFKITEETVLSATALLPQLEAVLRDGYALEKEESGEGISSVAVPILLKENELFGTLSVTALTSIYNKIWHNAMCEMKEYIPTLIDAVFADKR